MPQQPAADAALALEATRFGLYVHFPYCLSKCPYCDFASTVRHEIPQERYTAALAAELTARLERLERLPLLDTLYIGGGTPSLWRADLVHRFLALVAERLPFAPGAEVTLEANPGAADVAHLGQLRGAGITRLSMGIQSFQASTLATLGRAHDGATALRAVEAAHRAGFHNLSLDFIYGAPGQTRAQVEADARAAVALGPTHLSAYALTLEAEALAEEVPMARALARGALHLPPDEAVLDMRRTAAELYREAGLERYEVSNYARPGWHSRHNTLYWTGGETLAVGAGATGTTRVQGQWRRYSNLRSADAYLEAVERGQAPEASEEWLGELERFREGVAMGLRLKSGVALEALCRQFAQPFDERHRVAEALTAHGLAQWHGERLVLTDAGLDVHSAIAARLM